MAGATIIGDNKIPKKGNRTRVTIGTHKAL